MRIYLDNKYCRLEIGGVDNLINFDLYSNLRSFLSVYGPGYEMSNKYQNQKHVCLSCSYEVQTTQPYFSCLNCGKKELESSREWDGKISFLKYGMKFRFGFIYMVIGFLQDAGYRIEIIDQRTNLIPEPTKFVENLEVWDLRPFMVEDMKFFLSNNLYGFYNPSGIYSAATNSGKNTFLVSTFLTLNVKTLLLVHRKELFEQAYEFFTECGVEVSRFGRGKKELGFFTLAMVRTLKNASKSLNIKKYLRSVKCLQVDESHRASAAEYKTVIDHMNPFSTLYVSGTPLAHDEDVDKMNILARVGTQIKKISNKFLIEKGYSQKVFYKFLEYEERMPEGIPYLEEHDILKFSPSRMAALRKECEDNMGKQILIVVEHIDHGDFILENLEDLPTIVEFVHGSDKNRAEKLQRFKDGYCNILISSLIVKEGLNIPAINIGILALGGKSTITVLQLIGRVLRNDGINDSCLWVDFKDQGKYLEEHTQVREEIYEKEGFEKIN